MAGTCLITTDQDYVESLLAVIEAAYANYAEVVKEFSQLRLHKSIQEGVSNLAEISNIIFYLSFWDEATDDCSVVHYYKERAMVILGFTESQITSAQFTNTLLTERGLVFLTETGEETINQG